MFDLDRLNSATKYPSILTYHALGDRGRLTDEVQVDLRTDTVSVTEKVDGTNARIVVHDGRYIIGSREEFLHADGDLIYNPAQGIVDVIKPVAEKCLASGLGLSWVLFGEVYGGRVSAASKMYTGGDSSLTGFRVFDVVLFEVRDMTALLAREKSEISAWRESGGQPFLTVEAQEDVCRQLGLHRVPEVASTVPPSGLQETFAWLKGVLPGSTGVALHGAPSGQPEGVVVRTKDRSRIAKLRFEDYERTFRSKGK